MIFAQQLMSEVPGAWPHMTALHTFQQLNDISKSRYCTLLAGSRMAGDRFANRTTHDSFNRSAAAAGRRASTLRKSEGGFMPAQGPDGRATEDASAFLAREGGDADGSSSCLSCFVEVHFRGKRQRTSAVDSNTPNWNEQVGHIQHGLVSITVRYITFSAPLQCGTVNQT